MSAHTSLIAKQIVLLTAIASLSNAAQVVDNEELVIHYTSSSNATVTPLADEALQADILNESLCNEIRGSILELMDNKLMQLEALGVTISEEARSELQNTSQVTSSS